MTRLFTLLGAALLAAGCSNDRYTDSGFESFSAIAYFDADLDRVAVEGGDSVGGDGYVYVVGDTGGDGFAAYSGLTPGTDLATPPTTGSAVMSGRYEAGRISGIDVNGDRISGYPDRESSGISLTADFGRGTLRGTSDDTLLTVRGDFLGRTLSGEVIFDNDEGKLKGQVGPDKAVGIFHGNDETDVFAGGFIVRR